jgi:hypothetical protein
MKLYHILFESVGEPDVINLIKDIIKSKTETGVELKHAFLFRMQNNNPQTPIKELSDKLAKDIYEKNKPQFDRMFKGAKYVNLLGSGAIGVAFDIGDRILKIEKESKEYYSGGERAEKAATALYPEPKKPLEEEVDRKIGKHVPMIYDKGIISYSYEGTEVKLNWIIMEKFESIDGPEKTTLESLLQGIIHKFKYEKASLDLEKAKDINNYHSSYGIKDNHDYLGSKLRLKNGWFADLVQGMWELHKKGISDFHAGNIGIRRSGGEGFFVFFD